jgi:hypothetical protein
MIESVKGAISQVNVFSPMCHWTGAGRMTGQTGHNDRADLVRARSAGPALRMSGSVARLSNRAGAGLGRER